MASPAVFQTTVLHFAALHRANLYGREQGDDPQIIYYRTKSLRLLHTAISTSRETSDSDLPAIVSLATAESCFGDQEAAKIHTQGVREVITHRRETNKVAHNHPLELMFNWFVVNNSLSSHATAKTSKAVHTSLRGRLMYFVTTLQSFHAIALDHISTLRNYRSAMKLQGTMDVMRQSPLSRLSPCLIRILGPPLRSNPLYKHIVFRMSRFLTLLHIHTALYWFRDDLALSEAYLARLSQAATEMDLEHRLNPVFLLTWIVVADKQLHDNLRLWFAHSLAIIFKSLSVETGHQLSNWLVSLLALEADANGEVVLPNLDVEGLWREVMGIEPPG